MAFIRASGATKKYRDGDDWVTAVDAVDLAVNKGDFTAVMGPSGSGKSTLLFLLGSLIRPDGGTVEIDGEDIYAMNERQRSLFRNRHIGFVFQQFFLIPHLTAQENVMLPLAASGERGRDMGAKAREALEQVGLGRLTDRLPNQLSGGEQQRAAIARALVMKPSIILADEPTGNLDHESGGGVLEALDQLHRAGHTVLMVTHNQEAASRAGSIIYMRDGRIVESPAACAERNPNHETD